MKDFFNFRDQVQEDYSKDADKKKKQLVELEKDADDPCQPGWVQLGTKMKDGREVPNCVPLDEAKRKLASEDLEKDADDPCWEGYVQVGTKMQDGKEVPNCVPLDEARKRMRKEETLSEVREPFAVIDTADNDKVVATASSEKGAKESIASAERPPMRIKDKSTLKVVKTRKKQDIGFPLKEETLSEAAKYSYNAGKGYDVMAVVAYKDPMTRQRKTDKIYFKTKMDALAFKDDPKGFPQGAEVETIKEETLSEGYYDAPDYGPIGASEMKMTQLHFVKHAADEIIACLESGCIMPEWYQNKVAKVEGEMEGLLSYMKGKKSKMRSRRYSPMGGMYAEETEVLNEAKSGDKEAYRKFFDKALKKFGVNSPAELEGEKEKEFYDYVDKNWKSDKEESGQLNEVTKRMEKKYGKGVDLTQDKKGKYYIVPKKGDKVGPFDTMRDIQNHLNESYISEKLNPSDDVSKWIEDFYDSDAPQFKGKSKEERREMAVAAWLDARREAGYDVGPNPNE